MTATNDKIAEWARELASVREQGQRAEQDEREVLAGLRATRKRWAAREQELLDLISGRTGQQLPLVAAAPEAAPQEEEQPEEEIPWDGSMWWKAPKVPCCHILHASGDKKTVCGEPFPKKRESVSTEEVAANYETQACLDCVASSYSAAARLAAELRKLKRSAA